VGELSGYNTTINLQTKKNENIHRGLFSNELDAQDQEEMFEVGGGELEVRWEEFFEELGAVPFVVYFLVCGTFRWITNLS
jgi:hypothetical protein